MSISAATKGIPGIGLDRLYYAPLVSDTASGCTYGAAVRIQGVSKLDYNPNSMSELYYAEDGPYDAATQEGEIELGLTIAGMLPATYATLTGATQSATTGLVVDKNTDSPPYVALGYRRQYTDGSYKYVWVYKGKFTKPQESAQTKGSSINFQEEQFTFKAVARTYDGARRQSICSNDSIIVNLPLTDTDLVNESTGWFSTPNYTPAAGGTPLSDVSAAEGASSGQIELTFTAPTGATNVIVQIADPTLLVHSTAPSSTDTVTSTSTNATIKGLNPSTPYSCRLSVSGGTYAGASNATVATSHA